MDLMTIQETARILRVAPITVRRYIASSRLAAVRVGKGIRVRKEDIERLPAPILAKVVHINKKNVSNGKVTSKSDPLWNIVAAARSPKLSEISKNKHKYLAQAYADLHEQK